MTVASTNAAQILFKRQGGLLEYILTTVKKEFRFLIFFIFHKPYSRVWKPSHPM